MVSLEKSAKKVMVTQTTNKTTWGKETWKSSVTKTKTNPDQKPTNCESHRSLNSPEEQKRPIPTPAEKRKRLTNEETTIKKAFADGWQKCKQINLFNVERTNKNQSRIRSRTIHQWGCKSSLKLETYLLQIRITSKFAALASSPWSLSKFWTKVLPHFSLWLSIRSPRDTR